MTMLIPIKRREVWLFKTYRFAKNCPLAFVFISCIKITYDNLLLSEVKNGAILKQYKTIKYQSEKQTKKKNHKCVSWFVDNVKKSNILKCPQLVKRNVLRALLFLVFGVFWLSISPVTFVTRFVCSRKTHLQTKFFWNRYHIRGYSQMKQQKSKY